MGGRIFLLFLLGIVIALSVFLSVVYFVFFGFLSNKLTNPTETRTTELKHPVFFSVIVAFRNEKKHLPQALHSLLKQNYTHFEVLFVNDHSTDAGELLIQNSTDQRIKLLHLTTTNGKKSALRMAAQQARGSYLVFTDADVRHPTTWLASYAQKIRHEQPDLAVGHVVIQPNQSLFGQFQQMEFASLIASTLATCIVKKPIMCNGANLLVKRELYLQATPFLQNNQPSGDDVFLLHYAKKQQWHIACMLSKQNIVYTAASNTLRQFFQQRKRWSGKSIHYTDTDTIAVALLVFGVNITIVVSVVLGAWKPIILFSGLILFIPKLIIDYFYLKKYYGLYLKKIDTKTFVMLSFLYPFYITIVSVASFLFPTKWKNRLVH